MSAAKTDPWWVKILNTIAKPVWNFNTWVDKGQNWIWLAAVAFLLIGAMCVVVFFGAKEAKATQQRENAALIQRCLMCPEGKPQVTCAVQKWTHEKVQEHCR